MELNQVTFTYADELALDNISLTITPGSLVSLMGDNGSGKSTLLRLLAGLIYPTSGYYSLKGTVIDKDYLKKRQHLKTFHQYVGYVFQDSEVQLFNPTVTEEIAYGPRQMDLDQKTVMQRVNDCLALLGIEKLRSRSPLHLSGGEKKLVALAATLALNPQILLLDEPFNGLTRVNRIRVQKLLKQLNQVGKTIVIASHDYDDIQPLADTVVTLNSQHQLSYNGPLVEESVLNHLIV